MRAKQFINEIDRIGDIKPGNVIQLPPHTDVDDIIHDSEKLPGNNPYRYSIRKGSDSYTIYMIDSGPVADNEIIGKLVIEPTPFPLKGAGSVDYITVHKEYNGYGIAKSLYGIWLSILKRPLLAGSVQSTGGRRNWVSLNRVSGVQVKGYIQVSDKSFDNSDSDQLSDIQDSIMNTGGQYIGNDRFNNHYFSFDVTSNDDLGELEAVYHRAVKVYNDDYHHVTTGLYAVWAGR